MQGVIERARRRRERDRSDERHTRYGTGEIRWSTNITAERLAGKIDADEQFTLIDVRPEDSFEAWHVRDAENVSYDP